MRISLLAALSRSRLSEQSNNKNQIPLLALFRQRFFIMFSRIKGMHTMRDTQIFAANSSSSIGAVIFLPHILSLYDDCIVMFLLTFAYAVLGSDHATASSML